MRVIANMNGVMVAYAMGAVNAALAMVVAFGVNLSESQQGVRKATGRLFGMETIWSTQRS